MSQLQIRQARGLGEKDLYRWSGYPVIVVMYRFSHFAFGRPWMDALGERAATSCRRRRAATGTLRVHQGYAAFPLRPNRGLFFLLFFSH